MAVRGTNNSVMLLHRSICSIRFLLATVGQRPSDNNRREPLNNRKPPSSGQQR